VLAANEKGTPQFDYTGPGALNYSHSFESFTFEIGPVSGTPWIKGKGEMKVGDSNSLAIAIHSSSDRPFDIQLFGLATNNDMNLPEDRLKETLHVGKGDQNLRIERFVIFTYDFARH
jgi:hypothetical protein